MSATRENERLTELASALRASVIPLSRALRSTDTELTPTQLSVLGAVYRNERISMGELADSERLSPAMISRVVTSLVDCGYVERIPGQEDRRVCRVQITDPGHEWIEKGRGKRNAWLADRLVRLTPAEQRTLAAAAPLLRALVGEDTGRQGP